MILTTCPACAAPLAHDAPRCVRCRADGATLDDIREAVETLEETQRIARRVFGGAHPDVVGIEESLQVARAAPRPRNAAAVTVDFRQGWGLG